MTKIGDCLMTRSPVQYPANDLMKYSHSVFSGSIIYLGSNILNAAIPFVLLPVLTRVLSPDQYGAVAMFQTLVAGLNAVIGLGTVSASTRKHFELRSSTEYAQFVAACIHITIATSIIGLVACIGGASLVAKPLGISPTWIPIAVIVTASTVLTQLRLAQWQVRGSPLKYGVFQVGQSFANMMMSLLLVVVIRMGAEGRVIAQVAACSFAAAWAVISLQREGMLAFKVLRPNYIHEILRYGIPLVPHIFAAFLLYSVDRIVITSRLGLGEAGVYMVGVQFAAATSLVFDAISRSYTPWLFHKLNFTDDEELRSIVRLTYRWFVLILGSALLVFAVGPNLVRVIAGETYARAGAVVGWLVLGQAFVGMYLLLSAYLLYAKKTGLLSAVTVLTSALYLAILPHLVESYGSNGAAIGFASVMAIRLTMTWIAANYSHPMPWLKCFASSR